MIEHITLRRAIIDGLKFICFFTACIVSVTVVHYYLTVLFHLSTEIVLSILVIMTFLFSGVYKHAVKKTPLKEAIKDVLELVLITIGILILLNILLYLFK